MNPKLFINKLPPEEFGKLYVSLISFTLRIAFLHKKDMGAAKKDAEDIVQEALTRIFEETRNWNQDEYTDINGFFFGVVKSVADGKFNKSAYYKRYSPNVEIRGEYESGQDDSKVAIIPKETETPENLLIDEDLKNKVEEFLIEDEELFDYYTLKLKGFTKNKEIAKELNTSVTDIQNRRKRLKNRLDKFLLEN